MAFCCFFWQTRLLLAVHNAAMSQHDEQCLLYGVVVSYSAQSVTSRPGTTRGGDCLRPRAVHSRPAEGHAKSRSRRRLVKLSTQSRLVALRSPQCADDCSARRTPTIASTLLHAANTAQGTCAATTESGPYAAFKLLWYVGLWLAWKSSVSIFSAMAKSFCVALQCFIAA